MAGCAAPSTSPAGVPLDCVACAKFSHDDPAFVDKIARINSTVNAQITFENDVEHYGRDLWVMMPPDNRGDCDDYALTKMARLQDAGVDVIRNVRLVFVVVATGNGKVDGHAIVAVRLPSGAVAYMDNRWPYLLTRDELVRAGTQFFDWRA